MNPTPLLDLTTLKLDINNNYKRLFFIIAIFLSSKSNSQYSPISSNSNLLFHNRLINNYFRNSDFEVTKNRRFNFSYKYDYASNTGHPNIDNNAEFYAPGLSSQIFSFRSELSFKWLKIEIEPYQLKLNRKFNAQEISDTWQYTNNNNPLNDLNQTKIGFKQSRVILHYKSFGFSYGNMSHWWGPGLHSSIALSTNSPSQNTYSFGTYNNIKINKFSFGGNIIVMPYDSIDEVRLFFSGLRANITIHSNPELTFGLHRTFLSGSFSTSPLNPNDKFKEWSILDALKLVVEPIFGQSKKSLNYTIPGTPGFDKWDQVISGFAQVFFPKDDLLIFLELSSDDNRGNFTDLKAHWDHTLGYNLGFRKSTDLSFGKIFFSTEYLNTSITNTNNPKFYRGSPNAANYYIYESFDYFTYEGRRMGAHSGSSSDDLIFILGFQKLNNILLFTINKERHGIKYMKFPELKNELSIILNRKFKDKHSLTLTFEYEKIHNFAYRSNFSISKLFWASYSFSI